jgi:ubiquinone/menaquinone biosynthesis C-methylase UbiE
MKSKYWIEFWKDYTENISDGNEQTQVLRTKDKKPITQELWQFTLDEIEKEFPVQKGDKILDLCAGNGLFSRYFESKGAIVTAVDISSRLLENISNSKNITTINSDIRELIFEPKSFNKVFFYAGIQYLNDKEALVMIKDIYNWVEDDGILFVGDIPEEEKKFSFYNTIERQKVYFDNVLEDKEIIGNWFKKDWLDKLGKYCGFSKTKYLPQNEKLIYSNFRFDFKYVK